MAEPGKVRVESKQPIKKLDIATAKDFFYNDVVDTVSIRSRLDAIVKLTGAVSGKPYTWAGAGDIIYVDVRDKDEILNKKRGRACCGGQSGTSLFELV